MQAPKLKFEPAIYEHKAALIGRSPGEVSRSADLLARALRAEYETYRADFMTVGIDVYNLEIESVGAELIDGGPTACPDLRTAPFGLDSFDPPPLPGAEAGRFRMMIEAARLARAAIPDRVALRIAASGPLTIATRLVGIEEFVIALLTDDPKASELLGYTERLCLLWLDQVRSAAFDVILFDSTAAPPVVSPAMYVEHIAPIHSRIMKHLAASGQRDRPLIIGGDTVAIVPGLLSTGATTLICDFAARAQPFVDSVDPEALFDRWIRRNVDPALFLPSGNEVLESAAQTHLRDLRIFPNPISGTGILSYHSDPDLYLRFRAIVAQEYNR